jgi:hypothetical protein
MPVTATVPRAQKASSWYDVSVTQSVLKAAKKHKSIIMLKRASNYDTVVCCL